MFRKIKNKIRNVEESYAQKIVDAPNSKVFGIVHEKMKTRWSVLMVISFCVGAVLGWKCGFGVGAIFLLISFSLIGVTLFYRRITLKNYAEISVYGGSCILLKSPLKDTKIYIEDMISVEIKNSNELFVKHKGGETYLHGMRGVHLLRLFLYKDMGLIDELNVVG